MAIHFPKSLSYQARFNAWVSGICPYCNHRGIVESAAPTGRCFRCSSCGAENKFTLPRLIEEKAQ